MKYYDPTSGTLAVKARWRLAYALNRLPFTCWAGLVSWALGSRPLYDHLNEDDVRINSMCRMDAAESSCGRCYCGKLTAASTEATS